MEDILHVERVLQYSEALCCTWTSSCNIRLLLLSLLTKRVNNDTLIVTSCQTCQQRYHNNTITTPYLILRSLHHPTFYLVIQYIQIYTLKRTFSFGFANVKVLFLIKFIYSFFVFYFFGILNI